METLTRANFELLEVEFIPEKNDMISGKFYYSEKYKTGSHICPCGCGGEFSVPIKKGEWIIIDKIKLTIQPSFHHRINCRAHYVIQNGHANILQAGLPKEMRGVKQGYEHSQPGE